MKWLQATMGQQTNAASKYTLKPIAQAGGERCAFSFVLVFFRLFLTYIVLLSSAAQQPMSLSMNGVSQNSAPPAMPSPTNRSAPPVPIPLHIHILPLLLDAVLHLLRHLHIHILHLASLPLVLISRLLASRCSETSPCCCARRSCASASAKGSQSSASASDGWQADAETTSSSSV